VTADWSSHLVWGGPSRGAPNIRGSHLNATADSVACLRAADSGPVRARDRTTHLSRCVPCGRVTSMGLID